MEAWIKPSRCPPAGSFASVASKPESYSLQFNGPRLEFTIMQSSVRRRLQAPAGAISTGQAYHVVGTYDGTTQRLYVNGAEVASAPLTGAITANTNALDIGSWSEGRGPQGHDRRGRRLPERALGGAGQGALRRRARLTLRP